GQYDAAIQAYLDAERSGGGAWWVAWCDYGIASIYGRRGDSVNAVQYLRRAIARDSACKIEARTEPDFNPVRADPSFQALLR
ncbi:hypothetical protein, partial [Alicyclobacillus sp.]|uniref:TPR end-of-group domain-containing protein n=1 Tax=Alicyclobacillus sp. TaxID=61169 RepID=UPI0025BD1CD7